LPSFVAFGTRDITIPIDKSTQGIDWLREAGASLTTCDAPIGHKVSAGCLRSLEEWAVLASGAAKSSVRGAAGVV
jgi:predicted esterase